MKKMILGIAIAIVVGILALTITIVRPAIRTAQDTEADPQKMAQKITDFVLKNNEGVRFYEGNTFYEVSVFYDSSLSINFYITNRDFSKKRSAKDNIADTLAWGEAGIVVELHLFDDKSDGTIDTFQEFTKKEPPGVYIPFTRKERDLGERAGVVSQLIQGGETFIGNKWVEVSDEEKVYIQSVYELHLKKIVKLISLGNF